MHAHLTLFLSLSLDDRPCLGHITSDSYASHNMLPLLEVHISAVRVLWALSTLSQPLTGGSGTTSGANRSCQEPKSFYRLLTQQRRNTIALTPFSTHMRTFIKSGTHLQPHRECLLCCLTPSQGKKRHGASTTNSGLRLWSMHTRKSGANADFYQQSRTSQRSGVCQRRRPTTNSNDRCVRCRCALAASKRPGDSAVFDALICTTDRSFESESQQHASQTLGAQEQGREGRWRKDGDTKRFQSCYQRVSK